MLHILIHGDYTSIYYRAVLGIKFAYSQVQSSFNTKMNIKQIQVVVNKHNCGDDQSKISQFAKSKI